LEDGIKTLSDENKELVRQECTVILRKARPPKRNLNPEQPKAIKNLRNNNDIVILKADKGGATIIMNYEDYVSKMKDHLYNSGSYKKLEENPISKITRLVKKAIKDTNLDDKLKKRLTPDNEITPRIYGAPKVHKKEVPLRPIVNTIGSPTYELAKYVASILAPLVGKTSSYIKDSNQFVNFIKNTTVDPEDKLVSFDVVQLFTKIPLDEAIQVVKEVADPQTAKLAEICLRSTFFSFQGEIFEQTSGVAMGSPLSPIVDNLFMEKFETKALDSFPLKPKF